MTLIPHTPIAAEPKRPLRAWQAAAVPLVGEAIAARDEGIVVAVTGSGKSVALAEVIAQFLLSNGDLTVVVTTSSRRLVEQLADTIGERIGKRRVGRFFSSAKEADRQVVVACNNSAQALAAVLRRTSRAVNLWIADEAHRTEAEGLTIAARALQPVASVGFTATAFRSDESENLQLFSRVIYRYGFGDALRDQVIVPWRVVPWTASERPLDEAVLEMITTHAQGPGVVNASSIEDAETFAAWLTERGVAAAAVHSELAQVEQDRRLNSLRDGAIRVVVYPSLLSEGADFPWLRWICLRRKVSARVRFVQEVGRVLRTLPGKSEALILDPHGLFNTFSLTYEEDLGEKPPEEEVVGDPVKRELQERMAKTAMARPAEAVASWARQLWLSAELDGLLEQTKKRSTYGRTDPATPQQAAFIQKLSGVAKYLPEDHARVLRWVADKGPDSRGAAGDIIDVCLAVGKTHAPWSPSLPIWAPSTLVLTMSAMEQEALPWHAAGAMRQGHRAIAILQGDRVVKVDVRSELGEAQPHFIAIQVAAARVAARLAGAGAVVTVPDDATLRVLEGRSPVVDPRMQAALAGHAPAVTYRVQSDSPAKGIAWGAIARAMSPKRKAAS